MLNCQIGLYFLNQFPSCLMERLQPVFLLPVLLGWFETTTTMLVKCKTVKTHLYCSCQCTFCGNREALEEGCWEGASAAHSVPDPLYSRLCSRSATAFVLREAGCCLALPCPGWAVLAPSGCSSFSFPNRQFCVLEVCPVLAQPPQHFAALSLFHHVLFLKCFQLAWLVKCTTFIPMDFETLKPLLCIIHGISTSPESAFWTLNSCKAV